MITPRVDSKTLELARGWATSERHDPASVFARALIEREAPVKVGPVHGMFGHGWAKCGSCNRQVGRGNRYCPNCGARLEWV